MSSWTLTELVGIAARALVADGVRVDSGRVADVPNERLVRWYSTIGLVDRPAIGQGRTARYGERQLAQVVAVKRLQAQGLPLVEIQQRLVGAPDAELRRVAGLPDDLTAWVVTHLPDGGEQTHRQKGRLRHPDAERDNPEAGLFATPFWETRPSRPATTPAPVFGVTLSGVTLLLPAQPQHEDLEAIASAAAPLIDLLASRGLLTAKGSHQ